VHHGGSFVWAYFPVRVFREKNLKIWKICNINKVPYWQIYN